MTNSVITTISYLGPFKVVGINKLRRKTIYFSEEYLNSPPTNDFLINYELLFENFLKIQDTMKLIDERNNSFHIISVRSEYQYDFYSYFDSYENLESTCNLTVFCEDLNGKKLTAHYNNITFFGPNLDSISGQNLPVYIDHPLYFRIRDDLLEQSKDVYEACNNLVSISVNGYAGGRKVMKQIDNEIYKVYYPAYNYMDNREFIVFGLILLSIVLLLLTGILISSIMIIISKKIMRNRNKDFAIYRSIGVNKYMLARLVVLEQILLSLTAFVITIIVMLILKDNVYHVSRIFPYIQFYDYIILH